MKHADFQPQIEQVALEKLLPYARNSRTHSDEQVAQIAASIREFGFVNPVLIDARGTIIAGHGRVLAARKLGMDEVPAIQLTHLSDAQQRALVIADNKLALNAGWDYDKLAVEIDALKDDNFDVNLLGFTGKELAELVGTPNTGPDEGNDGQQGFGVSYTIVFDDQEQQDKWFAFCKGLKTRYPLHETLGARITAYIEEIGLANG